MKKFQKLDFLPRQKFGDVTFFMCFVIGIHHRFVFSLRLCMRQNRCITLDTIFVEPTRFLMAKIAWKVLKKAKITFWKKIQKFNFFPRQKIGEGSFFICCVIEKRHSSLFWIAYACAKKKVTLDSIFVDLARFSIAKISWKFVQKS